MAENDWENIAENFCRNSKFIRKSTEVAVRILLWCKFPEKGRWWSPIIAKLHNLRL